jgi:hypothetical protein
MASEDRDVLFRIGFAEHPQASAALEKMADAVEGAQVQMSGSSSKLSKQVVSQVSAVSQAVQASTATIDKLTQKLDTIVKQRMSVLDAANKAAGSSRGSGGSGRSGGGDSTQAMLGIDPKYQAIQDKFLEDVRTFDEKLASLTQERIDFIDQFHRKSTEDEQKYATRMKDLFGDQYENVVKYVDQVKKLIESHRDQMEVLADAGTGQKPGVDDDRMKEARNSIAEFHDFLAGAGGELEEAVSKNREMAEMAAKEWISRFRGVEQSLTENFRAVTRSEKMMERMFKKASVGIGQLLRAAAEWDIAKNGFTEKMIRQLLVVQATIDTVHGAWETVEAVMKGWGAFQQMIVAFDGIQAASAASSQLAAAGSAEVSTALKMQALSARDAADAHRMLNREMGAGRGQIGGAGRLVDAAMTGSSAMDVSREDAIKELSEELKQNQSLFKRISEVMNWLGSKMSSMTDRLKEMLTKGLTLSYGVGDAAATGGAQLFETRQAKDLLAKLERFDINDVKVKLKDFGKALGPAGQAIGNFAKTIGGTIVTIGKAIGSAGAGALSGVGSVVGSAIGGRFASASSGASGGMISTVMKTITTTLKLALTGLASVIFAVVGGIAKAAAALFAAGSTIGAAAALAAGGLIFAGKVIYETGQSIYKDGLMAGAALGSWSDKVADSEVKFVSWIGKVTGLFDLVGDSAVEDAEARRKELAEKQRDIDAMERQILEIQMKGARSRLQNSLSSEEKMYGLISSKESVSPAQKMELLSKGVNDLKVKLTEFGETGFDATKKLRNHYDELSRQLAESSAKVYQNPDTDERDDDEKQADLEAHQRLMAEHSEVRAAFEHEMNSAIEHRNSLYETLEGRLRAQREIVDSMKKDSVERFREELNGIEEVVRARQKEIDKIKESTKELIDRYKVENEQESKGSDRDFANLSKYEQKKFLGLINRAKSGESDFSDKELELLGRVRTDFTEKLVQDSASREARAAGFDSSSLIDTSEQQRELAQKQQEYQKERAAQDEQAKKLALMFNIPIEVARQKIDEMTKKEKETGKQVDIVDKRAVELKLTSNFDAQMSKLEERLVEIFKAQEAQEDARIQASVYRAMEAAKLQNQAKRQGEKAASQVK